jgi:TonB family protein
MTIRQTPSARDNVTTAFAGTASGSAWREFLDRLGLDVDALVLKKGFASSSPAVREATTWFVVSDPRVWRNIPITDLASALNPAGAIPFPDETEWAVFGRELVARRLGKSNALDGSGAIRRRGLKNQANTRTLAAVLELTGAERSALHEIMPDLAATPAVTGKQPPVAETKQVGRTTRTFPSIAPGFLGSLAAAVGCTPPSDTAAFGAARMSYHRDGRPRAIALDTTTLKPPCTPFVKFLAMLTVARPDQPIVDGESEWLLVSMDKAAISCADEETRKPWVFRGPERVGGHIKTPRKTTDVRPVYPESMRLGRIQGAVILEATIKSTGCVADVQVLRSVETPLDVAALRAVLGWRFEPTLLDGKPMPVIMTVTVNFTLQ